MITDYKIILVACGFIAFDIITGVIGALVRGDFESQKMRKGGIHKLFLILVIAFGVYLDIAQQYIQLGFQVPCNTSICVYVSIMEILSVLENVNLTFPNALPKALTDMLYQTAQKQGIETKKDLDQEVK